MWGHRIPVWYNLKENELTNITFIDSKKRTITGTYSDLIKNNDFNDIKKGLQSLIAPVNAKYYLSENEAIKKGPHVLQETDTFDTWFSSGQWPYSVLGWDPEGNHSDDFSYFYPTSVLDTMWDILFFWVARMIMLGIYATGQIPFSVAHMHSRVTDSKGQKMSKSKGNVIDPLTVSDQYGADALRMALVIGVAPGSDISLSDDKIRAQRNFVNKIWNASRFVEMMVDRLKEKNPKMIVSTDLLGLKLTKSDKDILMKLNKIVLSTTKNIENYHFGQASENLYHFFWHDFCDLYIEQAKSRGEDVIPVLLIVLQTSLKLLHPFIPFVTEIVYQNLQDKFNFKKEFLITSSWPTHEFAFEK